MEEEESENEAREGVRMGDGRSENGRIRRERGSENGRGRE